MAGWEDSDHVRPDLWAHTAGGATRQAASRSSRAPTVMSPSGPTPSSTHQVARVASRLVRRAVSEGVAHRSTWHSPTAPRSSPCGSPPTGSGRGSCHPTRWAGPPSWPTTSSAPRPAVGFCSSDRAATYYVPAAPTPNLDRSSRSTRPISTSCRFPPDRVTPTGRARS